MFSVTLSIPSVCMDGRRAHVSTNSVTCYISRVGPRALDGITVTEQNKQNETDQNRACIKNKSKSCMRC